MTTTKEAAVATDNQITIVGNLADDPDLRFTPNGVPVANVRVAVNQRFFNKDKNEWDERLDGFFTCNIWRDMAENVADSLHRGDRVLVTGRLRSRSYENKDGETRWVTEIEADEVCPSLRWARAKVDKVSRRRDPQSNAGQGNQDTSWSGAAPPTDAPSPENVPF